MMPLYVSLTVTLQIINTEYKMVHTSVKQTLWVLTIQKSPQVEIVRIKIKLENFMLWENSLLQTIIIIIQIS